MSGARTAIHLISTGGVYGAERALLELTAYLREQGWASRVVALEGRGAAELVRRAAAQGVTAEAFVTGGRMPVLPMLARLRRLLAAYPRAIVHSHGYKPDLLLALLRVPRRLACVATCHSALSEVPKLRFLESADRRLLRSFDQTVGVSAEICAELRHCGLDPARVALVSNGISVPAGDPAARGAVRAEFGLDPDCHLIVQIGRLVRCKRNDLVIAALRRLRDSERVHLLLVGEGEERDRLSAEVAQLELQERVHFCGYRGDVTRLLAAADALVLSSEREGLPIAILEAMAMRCPIVSTAVGAIPEVLRDGQDACLIPASDVAALSAAIDQVFADRQLARTRADSAHDRFRREYSRDTMGRRYLQIYEHIWTQRGWN
jgi:glycosyltransferase involved in cell wall biosynthesis